MHQSAKRVFVLDLIGNIQEDILARISDMPDAWDGHELRRYIADKFEDAVMTVGKKGLGGRAYRRRTRDYRNEVLVRNL